MSKQMCSKCRVYKKDHVYIGGRIICISCDDMMGNVDRVRMLTNSSGVGVQYAVVGIVKELEAEIARLKKRPPLPGNL